MKLFRLLGARILAATFLFSVASISFAQSWSDSAENSLVDHLIRGQSITWGGQTSSFASAPTFYVALETSAGSDTGCGSEVSGGNYARQSITASLASFSGTQGSGTTVASTGTGGASSNNNAITWSSVTWSATVTGYCIMSASSGGTMYWRANLTSSRTVASGDTVSFAAGAMTFTIGRFGDWITTAANDRGLAWAA